MSLALLSGNLDQVAVAERVLAATGPGMQYVDVSVPERAVVR